MAAPPAQFSGEAKFRHRYCTTKNERMGNVNMNPVAKPSFLPTSRLSGCKRLLYGAVYNNRIDNHKTSKQENDICEKESIAWPQTNGIPCAFFWQPRTLRNPSLIIGRRRKNDTETVLCGLNRTRTKRAGYQRVKKQREMCEIVFDEVKNDENDWWWMADG